MIYELVLSMEQVHAAEQREKIKIKILPWVLPLEVPLLKTKHHGQWCG
jgi:hypothetical protein